LRTRNTERLRALLALTLVFSGGIHAGLVPEHLSEMPPLGVGFIVAAVGAAVLAAGLVAVPERRLITPATAGFLVLEIAAWVAFITIPVPGFSDTPEPVEAIAVVCKAVELVALLLALRLVVMTRKGVNATFA
jgi:hypothetical protein